MQDWTKERGPATEPNFDRFVYSVGGARIDQRFGPLTGENADYIFADQRVLIELKIIETEFGDTEAFVHKENSILETMARNYGLGAILRGEPGPVQFYTERKTELYRSALSRIAKKANRQIRQTKAALRLEGYQGILMCVNDSLRQLSVETVLGLFGRILNGSNSQLKAFIYLTNHYVNIPNHNYASLLWVPAYAHDTDDHLPTFVNWLGRAWFDFCEAENGPADSRIDGPDIDIAGAHPIRELP